MALTRGGERGHRLWTERDAWLPYIDILKMNLEEAGCSWFPAGDVAGTTHRRAAGHGGPAAVRRALPATAA